MARAAGTKIARLGTDLTVRTPPHFVCDGCNLVLTIRSSHFDRYFIDKPVLCPSCGHAHEWWSSVLEDIRTLFVLDRAAIYAGASSISHRTTLRAGEWKKIDLSKHGLPKHAEIVALNMTSGGSARPLLVHPNAVPFELGPTFHIYGVAMPDGNEGPLYISAIWFARKPGDSVIRHLVDAARHHRASRYEAQIVSGHIAAEAALTPVVERALTVFGNADGRKAFFRDMKYSHQLHVLLDVVADRVRAPRLPIVLRALLNRMRGLRNTIAHEGGCSTIAQPVAAEFLCAAIFGAKYADFLRPRVERHLRSRAKRSATGRV